MSHAIRRPAGSACRPGVRPCPAGDVDAQRADVEAPLCYADHGLCTPVVQPGLFRLDRSFPVLLRDGTGRAVCPAGFERQGCGGQGDRQCAALRRCRPAWSRALLRADRVDPETTLGAAHRRDAGRVGRGRVVVRETIAILDFGSQYSQLIARRVRENHVFSLLCAPTITPAELRAMGAVGLILSGGPSSVYAAGAPRCDPALLNMGLPVLGICYGMQLGCELLGGDVTPTKTREYGRIALTVHDANVLMAHVPASTTVWMSHGDVVNDLPADFLPLASTPSCRFAAIKHQSRDFFGVQFHPEVTHTPY
ncbi:MAG: glutamine-hydrolyzing GMP synthase, partial [Phycisphaerae bacterium]|nr:glutamine-hydrolyzing GMP synthase [Phycisphaerae bacterium]